MTRHDDATVMDSRAARTGVFIITENDVATRDGRTVLPRVCRDGIDQQTPRRASPTRSQYGIESKMITDTID